MKPPPIYTPSVSAVLILMQGSTDHAYYAAEVQRETRFSKPTISWVFTKLSEAGFVRKEPETAAFMDRAPRMYYRLTDYGVGAIRLISPSA